jgi:hypothetical protein
MILWGGEDAAGCRQQWGSPPAAQTLIVRGEITSNDQVLNL